MSQQRSSALCVGAMALTAVLASSARAALVGYYPFDAGNANDMATADGAQNGTITGATSVPGLVGTGALDFVAASSQSVYANSNFTLNTTGVTISTWFRLDALGDRSLVQMPMAGASLGLNRSAVGLEISANNIQGGGRAADDGTATFVGEKITTNGVAGSWYTIQTGKVYFAAAVVDYSKMGTAGEEVNVYLYNATDDVWYGLDANTVSQPINTGHFTASMNTTGDKGLYIGKRGDNQRYFDGTIDEVRVHNEALSSAQVVALVPEPTSVALLGLAAAVMTCRRRRA